MTAPSQNNEAPSAATPKASEQVTDFSSTLSSAGSTRQDNGEKIPDTTAIRDALAVFHEADELIEIRCLPCVRHFHTRDLDGAARFALEQDAALQNCYHVINQLSPDIDNSTAAADNHIERIRWVPFDIDPDRAIEGTHSATDAEKAKARKLAQLVLHFWHARGIRPALVDSGNGFVVMVPTDLSRADSVHVRALLATHGATFDLEGAHIDLSVFNPARIMALPGTVKRKGATRQSDLGALLNFLMQVRETKYWMRTR